MNSPPTAGTTADPEQIMAHLDRTTDRIFGAEDLMTRLRAGTRLRIKFGVDCTAPDLHLGHAVNLWMMRYLQDLGHTVVFLLGDMTTRIGDPTGRSSTRPVMTPEEIDVNARAFLDQVGAVLRTDADALEVRRNSEWYEDMPIAELIGELSLVTVGQLMARDMFQARLAQEREIAMHELMYPILQGYDSVALRSDLTIVGTDQLFNETMARQIQARHHQMPQTVITSTITPGLDGGAKQSKSLGNYVGLAHDAGEKFGRLMTVQDELIETWARVYTELPLERVRELGERAHRGGASARDAKLDLAEAVVERYHGEREAARVRESFLAVFSRRRLPDDMPELALADLVPSVLELVLAARPDLTRSAVRRLAAEGAIRLDGTVQRDPGAVPCLDDGAVLQVGRRRWFRLRTRR